MARLLAAPGDARFAIGTVVIDDVDVETDGCEWPCNNGSDEPG